MNPDPDFSVAGIPFFEWLGERLHEAVTKAADAALLVPGEAFMIAIFNEPTMPARLWTDRQRRALRLWFSHEHGDLPGSMRLNLRHRLNPETNQDVRIALVTYDAKSKKQAS